MWRWFEVVWNTIKGESSFRIIGNNFFSPWAGFWELLNLFLSFFPVVLDVTETGCSQSWTPTEWEGFPPAYAWPWVIGTWESKGRNKNNLLHVSIILALWMQLGMGFHPSRLICSPDHPGRRCRTALEKKKLLKKIIGVAFIPRVEGKVGGRHAGSGRNALCIHFKVVIYASGFKPYLLSGMFMYSCWTWDNRVYKDI